MEVMDAGQKRHWSVSSVRTPPVSSRADVDFDALLDQGFLLNNCPTSLRDPDLTGVRGKNAVDFQKPIFFYSKGLMQLSGYLFFINYIGYVLLNHH